jgi:hypothetical protein
LTAAPYGSTTVWQFAGSSMVLTATAVPYKAGKQQGTGSAGSAATTGSGSGGQKSDASRVVETQLVMMLLSFSIVTVFGHF